MCTKRHYTSKQHIIFLMSKIIYNYLRYNDIYNQISLAINLIIVINYYLVN